jgi:single-strand DNA-binding protein
MASFNKVFLMGNLTRDPQMKYLPSQMPVCDFGLATNRRFKTQAGEDREEVCFIDCTAFGKPAEVIHQWCGKGKPIFIEGRLKFDQWEDKNGGGKRHKLTVVVEQFQFLPGRDQSGGTTSNAAEATPQPQQSSEKPAPPQPGRSGTGGGGRTRGSSSAQNPISEKAMFAEADIPF